jgi:hypothetical protein
MDSGRRKLQRTLDEDQIKDLKNALGFGVSWPVLEKHYGIPIAELQRLSGEPHWKIMPSYKTQGDLFEDGGGK